MALVTLTQAKTHLRIVDDDHNADVSMKAELASAQILIYLKAQAVAGWSDGTVPVPGPVLSAVYILLTHLYENRGDDMKADEGVWKAIERVLAQMRDPALA